MRHVGIKNISHDGCVAAIEDGKLVASIEAEKISNSLRYSLFPSIEQALNEIRKYTSSDIKPDEVIIDGYKDGTPVEGYPVAPYHFLDGREEPLLTEHRSGLYRSYHHVTGHIVGGYAMSPFSERKEAANVIVFDGSFEPYHFIVDPKAPVPIRPVAKINSFFGTLYSIMGIYFGPYKNRELSYLGDYSLPGKLMAYIGIAPTQRNSYFKNSVKMKFEELSKLYQGLPRSISHNGKLEHEFCKEVKKKANDYHIGDEEALATIHDCVGKSLANYLHNMRGPLILVGGSFLNIKWNSIINQNYKYEVFVPPVTNDSGSAIGMAAVSMVIKEGRWNLDWSVYSGPEADTYIDSVPKGFHKSYYNADDLAILLAQNPKFVIAAIHGRAEIGPRALGHRSLIANPVYPRMKDKLNGIKGREVWRPVSPMIEYDKFTSCFDGPADPYMLFDHRPVKDVRFAATMHIDGTSRAQTVSQGDCLTTYRLLSTFNAYTGIPALCNTSANYNGCGFFPGVKDALEWAKDRRCEGVWDGRNLYLKDGAFK